MQFPTFKRESEMLALGHNFVAGCDEVGAGPLAGPVVAAACILDPESVSGYRTEDKWFYRVRDSKTTYEKERLSLAEEIKSHCLSFGIGEVSPETIDRINIHNASRLAMKLAVTEMIKKMDSREDVKSKKFFVFLDGRFTIKDLDLENVSQEPVVGGDALILSIAAASIIAKVYRDELLKDIDQKYPEYGFGQHKGYGTKKHQQAIVEHGPTEFHRRSFLKKFN